MNRKNVTAYLASLLAAGVTGAIAGVAFNAPGWAVYLAIVVMLGINRIRDDIGGDS